MLPPRLIPSLLLDEGRLVKTVAFSDPIYLGDPLNAIKIFSDLEADELMLLDRHRARSRLSPDPDWLRPLLSECTMPVSYGGGLADVPAIEAVLQQGVEKVVLNTGAHTRPELIREAADRFGSQSVVCSIDVRRCGDGATEVMTRGGQVRLGESLRDVLTRAQDLGAGELLLSSIERDGMRTGFDLELISEAASVLTVPLVVAGGANSLEDCVLAVEAGASAVACGSMFVFHGPSEGVLISYPGMSERPPVLRSLSVENRPRIVID